MVKQKVKIDDFDLSKLPLLSCLSEQEMAIVREQCDACSFDPGDIDIKNVVNSINRSIL